MKKIISSVPVVLVAALFSLPARAEQAPSIGVTPAVSSATAPAAPAAAPAATAAPAPAAPASDVSLDEISTGSGVQDFQIVGKAEQFPAGTDLVTCLTA